MSTPLPAPQEVPQWASEAAYLILAQYAVKSKQPLDDVAAAIAATIIAHAQPALTAATEENSELKRRLEEQHKLYCEETKRHNATWAKIHAATGYLNKEFKKLPEDLLDAVKEVVFRVTLVELGRNSLQGEVAELRDKRKKLIEKLRESVNDTRELNDLAEALVDERGALREENERLKREVEAAEDKMCAIIHRNASKAEGKSNAN